MTDQESEAPGPKKISPFWWTRKDGQTDEEDEGEKKQKRKRMKEKSKREKKKEMK